MASSTASGDVLDRALASVRRIYADRPWLVSTDVLQSAAWIGAALQKLGASDVFALGASMGTGPLPEGVQQACLNVTADGVMQSIRACAAATATLPSEVRQRIDRWDPGGEARVVRQLFADGSDVAGRRCWGARLPEWLALEDKTVVDRIWDDCGVPRSPARVVDAREDALLEAHRELDQGQGTVWAADNRDGWHGGASGTRWVPDAEAVSARAAWMKEHAWTVRVMPFVEGVPCSIHGIVFEDDVVALRPCEMVVYRQPERGRFVYGRASTLWDPSPSDRAAMRAMAKRVGAWLRDRVNYRGTFTIDGVMGESGFRPTELNPRFGAAIGLLGRSLPELDLYLLHLAIVEGEPLDFKPVELEALLLHAADRHRQASTMVTIPRPLEEPRSGGFVQTASGWQSAGEAPPHATARLGEGPVGSALFISVDSEYFPVGRSIAPRMAELIQLLDQQWELGIGRLEAARSVR